MKKLLTLFLVFGPAILFAQSEMEIYLTPGLGYRTISVSAQTSPDFKDSLNQMDKVRQNWGGGVAYIHGFNRDFKLHFGLQYRRMSFTRVLEDLQYQDTVHPALGRIEDLSQNGQKNAYFYHKYHYVSVPVLLQTFIGPEYGRSEFSAHLITGVTVDVLLNDDIKVFLQGYSLKGKDKHSIPNDYKASVLNVNLVGGVKFRFPIGENMNFNVQPNFVFPILQTSSDDNVSMRLFQTNIRAGISLNL